MFIEKGKKYVTTMKCEEYMLAPVLVMQLNQLHLLLI